MKGKSTEGGSGNGLPRKNTKTWPEHAGIDLGKMKLSWTCN